MNDIISKKIMMIGEIEPSLAKDVISQIASINEYDNICEAQMKDYSRDPIEIYLTSGGGDVWSGFGIIGAIEMSETPVVVYGLGYVGSIALAIFLSCHVRFANKRTFFMYHSAYGNFMGDISSMEDNYQHLKDNQRMYDEIVLENTSLTQEQLDETKARRRDDIYTAQKALELGIVQYITEPAITEPVIFLEEEEED